MRKYLSAWWLGLALVLSSCTPSAPDSAVHMGLAQAPVNLDPRMATDAASARVNRLLYQALVRFDAHARPQPALADWQQLASDHYRFHLLKPVPRFHDGSAMTAHDVVATYDSMLKPGASPLAAEFSHIRKVWAVDDDTVDFTLDAADPEFPARLIIGVLPAHLIAAGHDFSRQPVGSGPLAFVSWRGPLVLQRGSDGQRYVLEEVKDPTVRVLKLVRGEIDLLAGDLPPELLVYLQQQTALKVEHTQGANFSYIGFNLQDPLLANPKVRQAIAHAIDRPAIVRLALVPDSRLAGAILPPEHWAGNASLTPYAHDPALARKLLQEAGVSLPLRLVYKTSTDAQRVRLATILQAQMREAGIELQIRSLDWGTFFDDIRQGHFQMYSLNWVGIRTPDIYRLAFHSASVPPLGANRGRLHDAGLDALIDRRNWPGATQRIHALLPYVPLWYEGQFVAMRRGLYHYTLAADGNWDGLITVTRNSTNDHAD
ncbi:ABC transporter substrate-binding protein [Methylovorus glucosotrophus]|uniref:Extracellular solute-binding protein family 5 n=1 Tax=Methylovorus glucosotrophus (strain SIP3-4) TaxID=582744 RepID=C6XCD7_METGS|nr:ABC transporter substrate-binding protein [Methylovorus glucosotrophus]ACT50212.1 extracellular solute-binding protein family 5 [Methylovorus glucosotrophus SIP3-4]